MSPLIRQLDHVAIGVWDIDDAIIRWTALLDVGLVHREKLDEPPVELAYLDVGNCFLQLVQPLSVDSQLAAWMREHGEGLHHICFGADDVPAVIASLDPPSAERRLGSGRGRPSGFISTAPDGVRVEFTQFVAEDREPRPPVGSGAP